MKNIFLLPTKKESSLFIGDLSKELHFNNSIEKGNSINQFIYITIKEDIKEGINQWYWDKLLQEPYNSGGAQYSSKQHVIILTNDPQLIADGIQEIKSSFLSYFVEKMRNEPVDYVEVESYLKDVGWESDNNSRDMMVIKTFHELIFNKKSL